MDMVETVNSIIEYLGAGQSAIGLVILAVSAGVEYVFPIFPGDTILLFGAFLAANRDWSIPLVFGAVTLGSLGGAGIDYAIGWRISRVSPDAATGRIGRARRKIDPILEKFRRHGAIYIAINRFLPGIRALFFVAAGMARLPVKSVLLWGALSAIAWNGLIIGAGFAIGKNWPRLLELMQTYTALAWVAIFLVIGVVLARRFLFKTKS